MEAMDRMINLYIYLIILPLYSIVFLLAWLWVYDIMLLFSELENHWHLLEVNLLKSLSGASPSLLAETKMMLTLPWYVTIFKRMEICFC